MRNRLPALIYSLALVAWVVFVAVVAFEVTVYSYIKNGIVGLFIGLLIGILGGAVVATIWAFILYFIIIIGRSIFLSIKPSSKKRGAEESHVEFAAKKSIPPMTRREKVSRFFVGIFFIVLGLACAYDIVSFIGKDAHNSIVACSIAAALFIFGGLKLIRSTNA